MKGDELLSREPPHPVHLSMWDGRLRRPRTAARGPHPLRIGPLDAAAFRPSGIAARPIRKASKGGNN